MRVEDKRQDWDHYFMDLADKVSERATCNRKHVGAVIVDSNHRLISTGYNGSAPGAPHCDDPPYFAECSVSKVKVEITKEEYEFHAKMKLHIVSHVLSKEKLQLHRSAIEKIEQERDLKYKGFPFYVRQGGHLIVDNHCVRTIHSEVNAITNAASRGISVAGCTLYCNTFPCWECVKVMAASGISKVIYKDDYKAKNGNLSQEMASELGIVLVPLV